MYEIKQGDSLGVLKTLPDRSVNTCVTSPPYYGLRDYGVEGQIGLEQTPDEYIAKLVAVFREVKRVLRDDGTLWLNIGDSYAANQSNNGGCSSRSTLSGGGGRYREGSKNESAYENNKPRKITHGVKPKDLIGIPWMLAFALRADGWYLRQEIIWAKSNPMPESVKDRCTKAHESLFLLSKSPKYYFDSEAMKEPAVGPAKKCGPKNDASRNDSDRTGIVRGDGVTRTRRSVWSIPTKPFKGAHFAVMPEALVEPCILAGCPESGTVLDPFSGAATVGLVALKNSRNYTGIELNPEYIAISRKRLQDYPEKQPQTEENWLAEFMELEVA
jgi:site-specific DNA-methyltransferase (adenine-specific)